MVLAFFKPVCERQGKGGGGKERKRKKSVYQYVNILSYFISGPGL